MSCTATAIEKRRYNFNITENVDGKDVNVMNFEFGGHHDLAKIARKLQDKYNLETKHADELALGVRLMHHVLKKYMQIPEFNGFLPQLDAFKHALKGTDCDK